MPQPFVFIRTGVLAAHPPHFYRDLAHEYGAAIVHPGEIKRQVSRGMPSNTTQGDLDLATKQEAQKRTVRALEVGINVVYDGFLNTVRRREQFREEVVAPTGAMAVLLCVHSPMPVIRERVIEKAECNPLNTPLNRDLNIGETLSIARDMLRNTEWPLDHEDALRLDGEQPTDSLLKEIRAYTDAKGHSL